MAAVALVPPWRPGCRNSRGVTRAGPSAWWSSTWRNTSGREGRLHFRAAGRNWGMIIVFFQRIIQTIQYLKTSKYVHVHASLTPKTDKSSKSSHLRSGEQRCRRLTEGRGDEWHQCVRPCEVQLNDMLEYTTRNGSQILCWGLFMWKHVTHHCQQGSTGNSVCEDKCVWRAGMPTGADQRVTSKKKTRLFGPQIPEVTKPEEV